MMQGYAVSLTPDDNNALLVTCRDFPELTTFGETEADALHYAQDALNTVIGQYMHRGLPVPDPSPTRPGERLVAITALVAAKVAIYHAMRARSLTQLALAELIGKDARQVRRLLDPFHASRFDEIERALSALGKTLVLEVADRAAA